MKKTTIALTAALALLAGCSNQELYSQLSERQANEMVAVLRSVGIDAEKRSQEGKFSVHTATSDFPQAVRALSAQGYPREQFDSMGTVFKREGFVSSPLEERARLVHALSQEISNTVAQIDGVVSARVHLVVPERNPLSDKVTPAAASVFIKHRPDKDFAPQVAQIKALVVNSIEGLPYDNVTVALFPAESLPIAPPASATPAPAAPATSSSNPITAGLSGNVPMLAGAGGGMVLALFGGLMWWGRRKPSAKPVSAIDDDATIAPLPRPSAATPNLKVRSREELQAALRRAAEQRA
jgi:type III secretion protein J